MFAKNDIIALNPNYLTLSHKWKLVNACYTGTDAIKSPDKSWAFLPIQANEKIEWEGNPDKPRTQYELRKSMAVFENFFKPIVDDITGVMQKNPPRIRFGVEKDTESAPEVIDLNVYGNRFNDGLKGLKWRLNFNQVLYGRYGMLLDIVTDTDGLKPRFCISEYPAEKILDGELIIDNKTGLSTIKWVLLDESTYSFDRKSKTWGTYLKLRVLGIDSHRLYYQSVLEGDSCYASWSAFDFDNPPEQCTIYPLFKQTPLRFVPFTVCNVNRLGLSEWQDPPYMDVAHIAVANYQVDSWYKIALKKHASPTLAVCNADSEPEKLFLGDAIYLRGIAQNQASVSLLETSGSGLAEMRNAKDSLKESLKYSSIRDLLDGAGANSSGEAIQLRTASGTASIASIDRAGSRAIEEQLVFASMWTGSTQTEAGERIAYDADTSYLGTDFQLPAIVSLLQANQNTQTLSRVNVYSLLEKAMPGVLSSFEDNEIQKATELEGEL